jgi:pyruvate/2-oxoglutarate dehydrogenase complex dihydrolipoamide dehydrogenase (E3) component
MQTAITAAQRGHNVILCEKTESLGGALRCERSIPFKKDLYGFIASKELEMRQAGVAVRLNTEVTKELAEKEAPDVLVVAVGADPIVPPIPGIGNSKVVVANNMSEENIEIGQKVVILGGGLVGCEAAVHLAQAGKDVTIIEMQKEVALDANERHRPIIMGILTGITKIETGLKGIRVNDEGLVCVDEQGTERIFPADTILCSVGQRPRRETVNELLDAAPEVVQVGDCVKPQRLTEAIFRGYYAGLDV